mmetsp:Transcript_10103/g.21417  ORF Transcript_10103/g.21417 Transcript_10103/m.21417 type:complete len:110 (-) Transcript_10103:65-394(-)
MPDGTVDEGRFVLRTVHAGMDAAKVEQSVGLILHQFARVDVVGEGTADEAERTRLGFRHQKVERIASEALQGAIQRSAGGGKRGGGRSSGGAGVGHPHCLLSVPTRTAA